MDKYLSILGFRCRDVVSGFEGVAESVCFDLYGCVQVALRPDSIKNGTGEQSYPDGRWLDHARLTVMTQTPVMPQPSFLSPGGPARSSLPPRG
jgi:hypothetical protein